MQYRPVLRATLLALFCTAFLASCGEGNTNISPTALVDQLIEDYETPQLAALPQELLTTDYGLDLDTVESYDVRESLLDGQPHVVAVIKASREEGADKAEAALQSRLDKLKQEFKGQEEASGLLEDAVSLRSGNYVFLAVGEFAAQMGEDFKSLTR